MELQSSGGNRPIKESYRQQLNDCSDGWGRGQGRGDTTLVRYWVFIWLESQECFSEEMAVALTQKSSSYLGEGWAPEEEQDIAGAVGWKKEKLDAAGAERGRKHRRLASLEADRHPSPTTCMSWAQLKHPLLWEAFGGPALSEEGPVLPLEPWPADLCILGSSHRLRHKLGICHGGVGRAGDWAWLGVFACWARREAAWLYERSFQRLSQRVAPILPAPV